MIFDRIIFTLLISLCQLTIGNCLLAQEPESSKKKDDYKLPDFQTNRPQFCFWNFPGDKKEAQNVLVVSDGDHLYVDRNRNRDLTETGERVVSKKDNTRSNSDHEFKVGEIRVGEFAHNSIRLSVMPLENFDRDNEAVKTQVKSDPDSNAYIFFAEVKTNRFRGKGTDGRVLVMAGPTDCDGVLQFSDSIASAPTINALGDLEIRLSGEMKLRPGSQTEIVTVVGTPGISEGTFASIGYEDVIPKMMKPNVTLTTKNEAGETDELEFDLGHRC